jgi:hypothetical protein
MNQSAVYSNTKDMKTGKSLKEEVCFKPTVKNKSEIILRFLVFVMKNLSKNLNFQNNVTLEVVT